MALVVANGSAVLDTLLYTPRIGAWHVDLHVDSLEKITGPVTIDVNSGALTLVGTAVPSRSGEFLDVARVSVTGGAGGLGRTAKPKRYRKASIRTILGNLLSDAGESLDPLASVAVLARQVADWTTKALPVGAVIADLFAQHAPDAAWRITLAGKMWVGVETWPTAVIPEGSFQLLEDAFEEGNARYALDAPAALVGTTFDGRRVSYVQTRVGPTGPVEVDVWVEDEASPSGTDRMKAALSAIVRAIAPGLDARFRYWAKVVQQSGSTIAVVPEVAGLPDMGDVSLALAPGESVTGVTGGRVLVGWTGDRAAVAHGFQGGTPASRTLGVSGTLNLGGEGGQSAVNGEALMTYLTALAASVPSAAPVAALLLAKKTKVT